MSESLRLISWAHLREGEVRYFSLPSVPKPFNEKVMNFAVRGVLTHSWALIVVIPASPSCVTDGYPWLPSLPQFLMLPFHLARTLWHKCYYPPFNR